MKKNIFYALMMPALLLGAVSCTDYQDDIDKLGAENDALRKYNNETISRLNSVVFQTEEGVVNITVDQPAATTIVYEVEPKTLATTLASIDANGVLTPIKNGTVTVLCISKDDPAVTASVTIEITGGNLPLDEGGVSQGGAE